MSNLLKFLTRQCFGILKMIFAGFILSKMWGWFIVSKFGLPPMDFKTAIGVLWVAAFLQFDTMLLMICNQAKTEMKTSGKLKDMDDSTFNILCVIITITIVYPFVLLVTYLWHVVLG